MVRGSQSATLVAPDAHSGPASTLGGGTEGQEAGTPLSLRAIARELGMSPVAATKYAQAESPTTKRLSAKERAKAEALATSSIAAD